MVYGGQICQPKIRARPKSIELGCSNSPLERYIQDIDKLSPYKIPLKSHKRGHKVPITNIDESHHRERDFKRPQMTSIKLTKLK